MMNILSYVGLLGSSWFLVHALRKRRTSSDWRYLAQAILGVMGISYGGLTLFEPKRFHTYGEARMFNSAEGLLAGAFFGMFITLCLAGWWRDILGRAADKELTAGAAAKPGAVRY